MDHLLRRALLLASLAAFCLPGPARAQERGPRRAYMDTTCAPCRDMWRYANGAWLDTVSIPPAYTMVGRSREMADRNQATILRVLERAAAGAGQEKDPTVRKVGLLYRLLMDSTRADREGLTPVRPELDRVNAIRTKQDMVRDFALLDAYTPFGFGAEVDPKHSTVSIGRLRQGGLGLPDRDYYFRTDPKSDSLRRFYTGHVARVLTMLGTPAGQARTDAEAILRLETALADSSLSVTEQREPEKLYHPMTVRELQALCPAIDWVGFFRGVGVKSLAAPTATLDVSMPAFMRQLGAQIQTVPLETWKAYLRYHEVRGALGWMSQAAFDELFSFNQRLTGQKVSLPRWKRAAGAVDGTMGEAVGKAFVATEFPPASKARMVELVGNLRLALKERIESRPWMSDATRKQALVKLDAFIQKIGYPDKWRDYSALTIDPRESAIANLRRAIILEVRRDLAKIGKPVDRTEWYMTPATVNAYYNPPTNEICFPAGILQPSMFDPLADDAANYGAIGSVIGHEMTHGFDDEGRKYDSAGNLRDWWTAEDGRKFEERSQKLVDQFDGYVGVDTLHVNGRFTLGENLGDLGGLTVAYHAWKLSLRGKPAPPVIDGLTPEQRFFLSYAQAWRRKLRPEMIRLQVQTDPHSPAQWRVIGPLVNMSEFAQAFGCKAGDPMVLDPEKRTEIW